MFVYIIKRLLFMLPILFGINVITFALFFMINTPDDMARAQLGQKHITQDAIDSWKTEHGYDKPVFWNQNKDGLEKMTHTLFFQKSLKLFIFDFGYSDAGRDISHDVVQRMFPSLMLAVPIFLLGLFFDILFALIMVLFRNTKIELYSIIFCVILMSISGMFYIIGGQYFFSKVLRLVPISGYQFGWEVIRFIILPIAVALISGIGSSARWYRSLLLEEINKDYVRTARAKGLSEFTVLFKHVLKNGMIPILTGVVVIIPSLFMGSLILESFFGIPGLGSYMIDAIAQQDFAIVRAMVFLGSVFYIVGLIMTDISYTLVDPRVRFN